MNHSKLLLMLAVLSTFLLYLCFQGSYELDDYVFDSRELPDDGLCGSFIGTVKVKKGEKDMACFAIHVHFDETEKDDELPLI